MLSCNAKLQGRKAAYGKASTACLSLHPEEVLLLQDSTKGKAAVGEG